MRRLVAVVGSTGTGKSDLALRIAKACNGEVINAEAVQLYKGLDIPCNKVVSQVTHGPGMDPHD